MFFAPVPATGFGRRGARGGSVVGRPQRFTITGDKIREKVDLKMAPTALKTAVLELGEPVTKDSSESEHKRDIM